ncbi:DUF4132 domain-containing protein [Actinomadura fibrosa]|uniref:DUF4132 domain-containing protein n=1 Tax=Actinomadura fibrosa TaxID=111802 RepID=A0ABW2XDQ8_9ACTN|nr:DUF4132 domain-containing protein [Actinomadura fibrosa]
MSENTVTIPDAWRRSLHPRRGGTPGPEIKIGPSAVRAMRKLIDGTDGAVKRFLDGGIGAEELTEAAWRHLSGTPDPSGAAAIATIVAMTVRESPQTVHRIFVDAWAAEHGLGFAACAALELSRMGGRRGRTGNHEVFGVVRGSGVNGTEPETLRRVRCLLAAADDASYADAVERLAAHRETWAARWVATYLVPARRDWLEEQLASDEEIKRADRWMMLCSVDRADLLGDPPLLLDGREANRGVLATMVDAMGADLLPFLLRNLGRPYLGAPLQKIYLETIAVLPSDAAFQAILDRLERKHARPALVAAMERFPVRALRLLAASEASGAEALLKEHVAANAEAVQAALPELPDEVREVVEPLAAASVRVPSAPDDALPVALLTPPWERTFRRPVLTGLEPPAARIIWADGERDEWLASDVSRISEPVKPDWQSLAAGSTSQIIQVLVHGPDEVVRPLLGGFEGVSRWDTDEWMRLLIARHELDAHPLAVRIAQKGPRCAPLLMPFLSADAALLMADGLGRKATADTARAWFDRHGIAAAPYLVPAALGKAPKPQRAAEQALREIGGDVTAAARAAFGDDAADAIGELLGAHPAETGLVKPPKIGDWADPAVLPQVLLRDRAAALPPDATARLIQLTALPVSYGTDEVKAVCDTASLAEFGWALFQKWRDMGAPSKDGWALTQLGRTGDDGTVRRLTPVIRAWPGEGGHKYAVNGLDVLAEIGTDVALMHLHGISEKVKFQGLKTRAQEKIAEVADRLGLGTDQLADRLVPTFGLDAAGTLRLDYGPRVFTVGFDEHLKPYVTDDQGKPRKALPKPGAKDDPVLAPAAHQAFTALKKDVRTVAAGLLRRFESAMATRRRWAPDDFQRFVVEHPLTWHVARRLVWITFGDSAEGGGVAFRIAEDRTLAGIDDDALTLPATAEVEVAHPLTLGDALPAWSEVFADYEILQPFPQLSRPVHTLADDERESERLHRFEGVTVDVRRLLGLVRHGWQRGEPQGGGNEMWMSYPVTPGRHVVLALYPGISAMEFDATGDRQTIERVWLGIEPDDHHFRVTKDAPLRFGDLDPVAASEIVATLTALTSPEEGHG